MSSGIGNPMSGQLARIFRGIASSAFSLTTRIVLQLAQVPLLLSLWGTERYGEWLLLSTIPVYLSLTGVGVSTVGGNLVCSALADKNETRARGVFRASWLLVTFSNAGLITLAAVTLPLALANDVFRFKSIAPIETTITIALLVLLVAMRLQIAVLIEIPFRARGRYAQAQTFETIVQIFEFLALTACVAIFGGVASAAAGLVATRGAAFFGATLHLLRRDRLLLDGKHTSLRDGMRDLLRPSLSLLLFPIAQSIQFEGVTLVIGYWLGSASVALYMTMRTLARAADMLLIMGYNLLMVEAAYLTGDDGLARKRMIFGLGTIVFLVVGAAAILGVRLIGEIAYPAWTVGELEFNSMLFFVVAGVALVRATYMPASALLVAASRHSELAAIHLAAAITSCAIAYVVGLLGGDLVSIAACALIAESILAVAAIHIAASMLGTSLFDCLKAGTAQAWQMPAFIIARYRGYRAGGPS